MIIGIDLGTTHSLVSVVRNGHPEVLPTLEGKKLLPSVLYFDNDKISLGYAAKKNRIINADHTVFSIKRLLGRKFSELTAVESNLPYDLVEHQNGVAVKIGDKKVTPIEVSSLILSELKKAAEKALGQKITQAVVTVPAYFNDAQRQATRTAGRLAGLNVVRMINEPTAAALAYGYGFSKDQKSKTIAVFDLGGGTFDLSILRLDSGVFEVLSTHGNTALGGDDLDQALYSKFAQEIKQKFNTDVDKNLELKATLLEQCEAVKIKFSTSDVAECRIDSPIEFTRQMMITEFEELVRPVLLKTKESCLQALSDAGLSNKDLDDVVMVGGPTRLKIVQKTAFEIFECEVNTSMHPDEVVAQGAAIQADILAGNNPDILLLDVVPLSLGIETYGGVMSTLIPRNSKIPIEAKEVFTTYVDNQTGVDIHVLQGERERVEGNRSLAKFKLKGITPQPASLPRIEVSFLIDADGILQVAAKDLKTGLEQSVEVKPSVGLSDQEINQALQESEVLKEEDLLYKRLVDAKNDAEPVFRATQKNLDLARLHLKNDEIERIESTLLSLKNALDGQDPDLINQKSMLLDQATRILADLIVKESLSSFKS